MKRNIILFVLSLGVLAVNAQVSEDFNPRNGVALSQLKGYLQNHCWMMPDFEVSHTIAEDNGALVSGLVAAANQHAGVFTPVLDIPGQLTVSFTWQFSQPLENSNRRWLKIYLTDPNNIILSRLDSIECSHGAVNTPTAYNKTFTGLQAGIYKLYINYQGTGGNTRISIDQLAISAPFHYAGGCNSAPVAVNDQVNGLPNRTAAGQVTANDKDPDHDAFRAYLINGSPDGTVSLKGDGSFTFTPNPGFTGNSTTFSYKLCDNGWGRLCSEDATVKLSFPTESVSLKDFAGLYNTGGEVALSWITNFEQNSNRFEIERSIDGNKWLSAGTVKAQGISYEKRSYEFLDEVGRTTALKKDLYYRLKQIDNEGKVATSRILVVRVYNTHAVKMVSVTPNPAVNDIAVTAQLNESGFVAMKILNADGAIIMNKASKADAGANSFIMEGSSRLQPGMYTLDVTVNSKERMMVKLIKE
jgi:hypothetical protein